MSDYYTANYLNYHEKTFPIDPSSFLGSFAATLPQNALVLDVGCGSGRDLLWLSSLGFHVIGFERSRGLADLARQHAGCEIIKGDFETYNFSNLAVDGIVMTGAFVHVAHERLEKVFANVTQAFRKRSGDPSSVQQQGVAYISLKEGDGSRIDSEGRKFYLWRDKDLRKLVGAQGFSVIDFQRSESVLGSGDVWLGYVLESRTGNGFPSEGV